MLLLEERTGVNGNTEPSALLYGRDVLRTFFRTPEEDFRVGRARLQLLKNARAPEGITLNRASGVARVAPFEPLDPCMMILLFLVGVVEQPPSFIKADGLHIVASKLVDAFSLALHGCLW